MTDWPWSITTEVGEIVTVGAESTVTAALVVGVATGVGVAPPVVPASVSVTVSTQFAVVPVGEYVSVLAPESANPGQLPDAIDQTYVKLPVPPDGVTVMVTDCPRSITTEVGAIVMVGVASTVTDDLIAGVAVGAGLAPPVVPVPVTVTVSTHVVVVPVGVYVSETVPEPEKPGHVPEPIDHA